MNALQEVAVEFSKSKLKARGGSDGNCEMGVAGIFESSGGMVLTDTPALTPARSPEER